MPESLRVEYTPPDNRSDFKMSRLRILKFGHLPVCLIHLEN